MALRTNILANYAGQAWMALMTLAFVPLYAKALGYEAFGLVGVMLSLQAMSLLLDLGMGGVMNREMARRATDPALAGSMRDLTRTFEWLIWPVALLIALTLWLSAPWLVRHWLNPKELSAAQTIQAVRLMGIAVAAQWPSTFYVSGLSGLERQPAANFINAIFATLRGAGSVGMLYAISATVNAFMGWQAFVGIAQSLVAAIVLRSALPKGQARFVGEELRSTYRFAGSVMAITALSIATTQLDRLLLSAMRSLAEVGYFTIAITVAAGLGRLVQPVFNATYPRFSRLVATDDLDTLAVLYRDTSQYLLIVVAAATGVLLAFPESLLYLWTGDARTAEVVALPMSLLILGTFLNGIMNLPYALQLAHGWTRLSIRLNAIALAVSVTVGIPLVAYEGIVGAAWLWLITNAILAFGGLPLMHRRLMQGQLKMWVRESVAPPIFAATACSAALAVILPPISRSVIGLMQVGLIVALVLTATTLSLPLGRRRLMGTLRTAKRIFQRSNLRSNDP